MSYRYTFNGVTHTMSGAEAEAIERSGPPHRVQDYAMSVGSETFCDHARGALALGARLMSERPGAIEPGLRRTLAEEIADGKGLPWDLMTKGKIHLSVVKERHTHKACGGHARKGETFGTRVFATMMDHPRVCPDCLSAYFTMKMEKVEAVARAIVRTVANRDRRSDGYVKTLNWTKEERQRLKKYRKEAPYEASGYFSSRMPQKRSV